MDKATEFISEHIGPFWHRGWAAFILAASLGISAFLTAVISLGGEISWVSVTSGLLSFTITAGFWLLTHHIPRTPKGKVGIIIAITSDDQNEAAQIRADFVSKLREALQQTPDTVSFHPIVLPEFAADLVVNASQQAQFLGKTRGHMLIYGTARLRTLEGKDTHVLNLNGMVVHKPIPKEAQSRLVTEFRDALPRNMIIPRDGDFMAFEINSSLVDLGVRYVIGIAAHLSGDFRFAEAQYLNVEKRLTTHGAILIQQRAIARDLPKRIVELYQVWLAVVTNAFVMRRDRQFIVEKDAIAKKLLPRDPKNYQALLSLAMAEFLLHRNVAAARAHLKQCEGIENNIWHYSLAFLSGYEADLQAAHDSYRTAFRKPTTDVTVPLQCEEFIQEILRDEPHQTQLCFCSGLINYNAKPDYVAALRDFEKFHTSPSAANHPWAKDLSKRLIEQCRKKIAESR